MFWDTLKSSVKKANEEYKTSFKYKDIETELKLIRVLDNISDKTDGDIVDRVYELELLIFCFKDMYEKLVKALNKKEIDIWHNKDKRDYGIRIVFLLKKLIQDFIAIKYLVNNRCEDQMISISRNIFEKINILRLCLVDYEYSKVIFFNDENIDMKKMYFNYTRPKAVESALKKYVEDIEKEERKTGKVFMRFDKDIIKSAIKSNQQIMYSFYSKFTHGNDIDELMNYEIENEGIDLSLSKTQTKHFKYRIDYLNETLMIFYSDLNLLFTNRIPKSCTFKYNELIIEYYGLTIYRKYK